MKWFLISEETVDEIRGKLDVAPMGGRYAVRCAQALHMLESGLHTTDAIPEGLKRKPGRPPKKKE